MAGVESDDKMWVWSNFQIELDNKIRSEYAKAERLRSELASASKVCFITIHHQTKQSSHESITKSI